MIDINEIKREVDLIKLLDHMELINWIHYSAYKAAKIGQTTINLDEREFITLPSGKKVVITIKIEEFEE